jgi:lysophospholipid acyltransferase
VTAGFFTTLGRQFRRYVRPYFLPADNTSASPNSLPKYPYPNAKKRLYDLIGWFVVQINLNYVACAFMLLSFKGCLTAWQRMGYYGHVMIALATAFFRFGGRRLLRKGVKTEPKKDKRDVPNLQVSPPSPPEDETDPKDLRWVKHALDNPSYQDGGEGVHLDEVMMDEWMESPETPSIEKPRPKEW